MTMRQVDQKKPLDPYATDNVLPTAAAPQASLPFNQKPPKPTPVPGVPAAPPAPAGPGAPPAPTPVPSQPAPSGPGAPPTPTPLPTQLPDGQGGAVNVPPAGVTPATQGFDFESNLINTQVNPTSDPRTMNLQGLEDAQLQKMVNGPDRNAMAKEQYDTWNAETNPGFEHSITDATDAAAAHGQIRSGQLTNRYGDLAQQRVLDQTTARNKYMQQALSDSVGDTRAAYGAASDSAARAYSEGASGRNELRGERGYQASQAEQALLNRIRQQQAEQQAQGQAFGQGAALYGMGSEGDPTGAYQEAAGQAGQEASSSYGDIQALLTMLGRRKAAAA